jgi:hypothetical protein
MPNLIQLPIKVNAEGPNLALYGGRPKHVRNTLVPFLVKAGANIISYTEEYSIVPAEATAIVLFSTRCSHKLADKLQTIAKTREIPCVMVPHHTSKALPLLISAGILPTPPITDIVGDTEMLDAGQVKAAVGPELKAFQNKLDSLSSQQTALEALIKEPALTENQLRDLKLQITGMQNHQASLEAKLSEVLKNPARTREQEQPVVEATTLKVNTQTVAEKIVSFLGETYPHPLTKVDWQKAGMDLGMTAENMLSLVTSLYGNPGLSETMLQPLNRCGWQLALVHGTTAFPLSGENPLTVTSFKGTVSTKDSEQPVMSLSEQVSKNPNLPFVERAALVVTQAGRPVTITEVAKELGVARSLARHHLNNATQSRRITRMEPGVFCARSVN